MRRPVLNAEKYLDELYDEMTDAEQREYEDFWNDMEPWRKAMNWSTRGLLVLLVAGLYFNNSVIIGVGVVLFCFLAAGGAILLFAIQNGCAGMAVKILTRLGQRS